MTKDQPEPRPPIDKSKRFSWPRGATLRLATFQAAGRRYLCAVGSGTPSVRVLDVSSPATPRVVSTMDLGCVTDVATYEQCCFCCSVDRGIVTLDCATPETPSVGAEWGATLPALPCSIGVIEPPDYERPVRLVVALRALPSADGPIEDFFTDGLAASAWEGPPPETARDVETEGDLGVLVLEHRPDASDERLVQVGYRAYPKINQIRFTGYHQPWEVATLGDHALVAAGRSGLLHFDLSRLDIIDPGFEFCPGPRMRGVKAAGHYIFLTGDGALAKNTRPNGLVILDYTNPAQPRTVHPWRGRGAEPACRCQLYGGGLLVLEERALCYYDCSSPSLPSLATRHELTNRTATDLVAFDGYVYVASLDGSISVWRMHRGELVGTGPRFEAVTELSY